MCRCSPLMAELWGIHDGLKIVVEKGFMNVIMESNSKDAVDIVNRVKKHKLAYCNLMFQIHSFMGMLDNVEIYHIYREKLMVVQIC